MACLDEDVKNFPNQLETPLGEWGINLSGGQKQRLTLARALSVGSDHLILDDCLSAVDTVTEEKILDNLDEYLNGKTIIWVAHRDSTLKNVMRSLILMNFSLTDVFVMIKVELMFMTEERMSNGYLSADEQDESVLTKNRSEDFRAFVQVLREARSFWKSYLSGALLLIGATIVLIYSAKTIGDFVEKGLLEKDKELALKLGTIIIVLEFLGVSLQWAGRSLLANGASHTILRIRHKLFRHLQLLPISFFDHQPQGRVVTRVTHDVEGMEDFFVSSLGRLSSAVFFAITSIFAMCIADFKLGSILISSTIPAILFIYITRNSVRRVNRRMTKSSSATNSKLAEFISGLEVIRIFGTRGLV